MIITTVFWIIMVVINIFWIIVSGLLFINTKYIIKENRKLRKENEETLIKLASERRENCVLLNRFAKETKKNIDNLVEE